MSRYESLRQNEEVVLKRTRRFLRENKFVVLEKTKSKVPPTNPIAIAWDEFAKTATAKTTVFETIPIIFAMTETPPDQITMAEMREILNRPKDWDKTAKDWLNGVFDALIEDDDLTDEQSEKLFKSFISNVVYGQGESRQSPIITPGAPSLKDLNGGQVISDFIHGSIKGKGGFYSVLQQDEGSKDFTADVILFWENENASKDILTGGDESPLKNAEIDDENPDLMILSDDSKMACVSLKAFVGKIGKITRFVLHKYDDGSIEIDSDDDTNENLEINEGFLDSFEGVFSKALTWISNTKVAKKLKEWYDGFTKWSTEFFGKIQKIVSPSSPDVLSGKSEYERMKKEADSLLEEFDKQLEEQIKRNGIISEDKSEEKLQMTDCYYNKLKSWYELFGKDMSNYNKTFQEFNKSVGQYQNNPFFKLQFESLKLDDEKFTKWSESVKKLMEQDFAQLKPGEKSSKKSSCKVLLQGGEVFRLSRAELKPYLMSNANFASIGVLKKMVDRCLGSYKEEDVKNAINDLIKFSTEINAEAVFGGVSNIPLVKYNGTSIERLGTRKQYEEKTVKELSNAFKKDIDIPIVGIKIFPARLKKQGDPFPTWYTVLMYSLAGIDEKIEKGKNDTRPIKEKLLYNEIRYSCNSGSKFSFASEGIKRISGTDLERYLKSETIPS